MQKFRVSRFEDVPEVSRKLDAGLTDEQMWARRIVNKHLSHHAESIKRYEPLAYSVTSGLVRGLERRRTGGAGSYMKKPDYENVAMHVLIGGSLESPGERCHPRSAERDRAVQRISSPDAPRNDFRTPFGTGQSGSPIHAIRSRRE